MRRSKILAKLRMNKPVLLVSITLAPSALAVEIAGRAGIDGLWLDMEHRPWGQREVAAQIIAGRMVDIDTMVRIRKGEGYTSFFRPLEDGATGIMVPHVKTREEAEWVVRNAKYPPLGRRGVETAMSDADTLFADPHEYLEHANRETFVVLQIEDAEALDQLSEIAAVPGLDVLFVGPADLSLSLGVPFDFGSRRFREAVDAVAAAARAHNLHWGLPVPSVEDAARYAEQGARFFPLGGDFGWFKQACLEVRQRFDAVFGECDPD